MRDLCSAAQGFLLEPGLSASSRLSWEGCLCRGTCGELLHYANLIILSDIIDVSSHHRMKFGRWSVEGSPCNF